MIECLTALFPFVIELGSCIYIHCTQTSELTHIGTGSLNLVTLLGSLCIHVIGSVATIGWNCYVSRLSLHFLRL